MKQKARSTLCILLFFYYNAAKFEKLPHAAATAAGGSGPGLGVTRPGQPGKAFSLSTIPIPYACPSSHRESWKVILMAVFGRKANTTKGGKGRENLFNFYTVQMDSGCGCFAPTSRSSCHFPVALLSASFPVFSIAFLIPQSLVCHSPCHRLRCVGRTELRDSICQLLRFTRFDSQPKNFNRGPPSSHFKSNRGWHN